MPIRFTLNGRPVEVADVDPHETVLHWLRRQGLTGTKEGCAEGECGACAVALVRKDAEGRTRYDAVNSCLLLLGAVADRELVTVEGVGGVAALHPVQEAMVERGGSQCGYCTPGFVVSMFAEYYRPGREGFDPDSISGNLCRCTGYRPIREAMAAMGAPAADDGFLVRLRNPEPEPTSRRFEHEGRRFYRPTTLEELFRVLGDEPEGRLVSGGTDVVVDVNQRHDRFPAIVAIDGIDALRDFAWHDDHVHIGAAVTLRELEARLAGKLPLMEQLLPLFSSRLIRNRATFGGNLATASPIGDGPPVLLALGAEVVLASAKGERILPLDEFFPAYRQTALGPGEIIRAVRIPRPFPGKSRFYKVSKRVLDDISTVAAAFALDTDDAGVITAARLAFGGVAATPVRARDVEEQLVGRALTEDTLKKASLALAQAFAPITDHRGSAAYRKAVMPRLLEKFFHEIGGVP